MENCPFLFDKNFLVNTTIVKRIAPLARSTYSKKIVTRSTSGFRRCSLTVNRLVPTFLLYHLFSFVVKLFNCLNE